MMTVTRKREWGAGASQTLEKKMAEPNLGKKNLSPFGGEDATGLGV